MTRRRLKPGDVVECVSDPHGWGKVDSVDGDKVIALFWVGFTYKVISTHDNFKRISPSLYERSRFIKMPL